MVSALGLVFRQSNILGLRDTEGATTERVTSTSIPKSKPDKALVVRRNSIFGYKQSIGSDNGAVIRENLTENQAAVQYEGRVFRRQLLPHHIVALRPSWRDVMFVRKCATIASVLKGVADRDVRSQRERRVGSGKDTDRRHAESGMENGMRGDVEITFGMKPSKREFDARSPGMKVGGLDRNTPTFDDREILPDCAVLARCHALDSEFKIDPPVNRYNFTLLVDGSHEHTQSVGEVIRVPIGGRTLDVQCLDRVLCGRSLLLPAPYASTIIGKETVIISGPPEKRTGRRHDVIETSR